MPTESQFGKLVPGFDFLQGLASNASSALPGIGQWIAPTLNPEELDKRISELRTVQFWLEQNARLLAATVQALEVQRMTLVTLRSMNVPMSPLHESLRAQPPEAPPPAQAQRRKPGGKAAEPTAGAEGAAVDPMQWWGALTQQFTELAASAMKEALADHKPPAGAGAPPDHAASSARQARPAGGVPPAGPTAAATPDAPAGAAPGRAGMRSGTAPDTAAPAARPGEAAPRRRAPHASNAR